MTCLCATLARPASLASSTNASSFKCSLNIALWAVCRLNHVRRPSSAVPSVRARSGTPASIRYTSSVLGGSGKSRRGGGFGTLLIGLSSGRHLSGSKADLEVFVVSIPLGPEGFLTRAVGDVLRPGEKLLSLRTWTVWVDSASQSFSSAIRTDERADPSSRLSSSIGTGAGSWRSRTGEDKMGFEIARETLDWRGQLLLPTILMRTELVDPMRSCAIECRMRLIVLSRITTASSLSRSAGVAGCFSRVPVRCLGSVCFRAATRPRPASAGLWAGALCRGDDRRAVWSKGGCAVLSKLGRWASLEASSPFGVAFSSALAVWGDCQRPKTQAAYVGTRRQRAGAGQHNRPRMRARLPVD